MKWILSFIFVGVLFSVFSSCSECENESRPYAAVYFLGQDSTAWPIQVSASFLAPIEVTNAQATLPLNLTETRATYFIKFNNRPTADMLTLNYRIESGAENDCGYYLYATDLEPDFEASSFKAEDIEYRIIRDY